MRHFAHDRQKIVKTLIHFLLFTAPIGLSAQSTLGTISGSVAGEDGAPLSGVRIIANASLSKSSKLPGLLVTGPVRGQAVSASNGTFTIEHLPPGTYTLCAQGSPTHLDPCNWSQIAPEATVASNEKSNSTKLKLVKGGILQVRLNDSKNLLNSARTATSVPYVLMGVSSHAGHFYPLVNTAQDSAGRTNKLLVPLHENFELQIVSRSLVLTDQDQKPLPATGYALQIHIDAVTPLVLTFNITGTRGQ